VLGLKKGGENKMCKVRACALLLLFAVGLVFCALPVTSASSSRNVKKLMTGAAKVTITPAVNAEDPYSNPVWMGGWGRRVAVGVHDELYARCIVVRSYNTINRKGTTIALVAVDLIGLFYPYVQEIRALVDPSLGIDHIIIASTHNHEGPDTLGLWGPDDFTSGVDPEYMDFVKLQVVSCIETAAMKMEQTRLEVAHTTVPGIMVNARDPGLVYPDLVVMKFVSDGGKTIATVLNFAGHPEVLDGPPYNYLISADYLAYVYEYIEDKLGGVAVFFNGALGGMITPDVDGVFDGIETPGLPVNRTFEMAEEIGSRLAKAAIEALENAEVCKNTNIVFKKKTIDIPLENFNFRLLMSQPFPAILSRDLYTNGELDTSSMDISEWFNLPSGTMIMPLGEDLRTEINVVKIGYIEIVTVPGELLPKLGHQLMETMMGKYNIIIGLGNDELGYIIPFEDWDPAKYEESMSVGRETGPIILSALKALIEEVELQ
jgi:hypothetical protein